MNKQACFFYLASMMLSFGLLAMPTSVDAANLSNGLLAHWSFDDGTAADSSGNDFHGTFHDGGGASVTGLVGNALQFSGGWIKVDHAGELNFDVLTESYTFSALFKFSPSASGSNTIIQDRYGSNARVSYNMGGTPGNNPNFGSNSWMGTGNFHVNTLLDPLADQWYHALVINEAGVGKRFYIDGQLVQQIGPWTGGGSSVNTTNAITIAGYWSSRNVVENRFTGSLDELRLYSRALSQSEINELASAAEPIPAPLAVAGALICMGYIVKRRTM